MDGHKTVGFSPGSAEALDSMDTLYIGGHQYYRVSCSFTTKLDC